MADFFLYNAEEYLSTDTNDLKELTNRISTDWQRQLQGPSPAAISACLDPRLRRFKLAADFGKDSLHGKLGVYGIFEESPPKHDGYHGLDSRCWRSQPDQKPVCFHIGISPKAKSGIYGRLKKHFTEDMTNNYGYGYGWLRESMGIHVCSAIINGICGKRLRELENRLSAELKPFYLILDAFKPIP